MTTSSAPNDGKASHSISIKELLEHAEDLDDLRAAVAADPAGMLNALCTVEFEDGMEVGGAMEAILAIAIREALRAGALPDPPNRSLGHLALCAQAGRVRCVKALLAGGALVDGLDATWSPLRLTLPQGGAGNESAQDCALLLVEAGAGLGDEATLISQVASSQQSRLLRALLAKGMSPNIAGPDERSLFENALDACLSYGGADRSRRARAVWEELVCAGGDPALAMGEERLRALMERLASSRHGLGHLASELRALMESAQLSRAVDARAPAKPSPRI